MFQPGPPWVTSKAYWRRIRLARIVTNVRKAADLAIAHPLSFNIKVQFEPSPEVNNFFIFVQTLGLKGSSRFAGYRFDSIKDTFG